MFKLTHCAFNEQALWKSSCDHENVDVLKNRSHLMGKKNKTIKNKCARKAENEKEPDERSEVKWDKWNISATLKETYKNHTWRKDWRVIFLQWKKKEHC